MASLRVGLAGLGTVGGSVLKRLIDDSGMIERRAGTRVEVAGVSVPHPPGPRRPDRRSQMVR